MKHYAAMLKRAHRDYAMKLREPLQKMIAQGASLAKMASALQDQGIETFCQVARSGRKIGGKKITSGYVHKLIEACGLGDHWRQVLNERNAQWLAQAKQLAQAKMAQQQAQLLARQAAQAVRSQTVPATTPLQVARAATAKRCLSAVGLGNAATAATSRGAKRPRRGKRS